MTTRDWGKQEQERYPLEKQQRYLRALEQAALRLWQQTLFFPQNDGSFDPFDILATEYQITRATRIREIVQQTIQDMELPAISEKDLLKIVFQEALRQKDKK